jgi:diguanylate cyclase (GGDEF)-like protein
MSVGKGSANTERPKRATRSLYKSYFRTLYLGRLARVAFWACFAYFIIWATPFLGVGLSFKDYTPQFLATLGFAGCCMILGLLAATFQSMARRKRDALVAWSSLYDETTGTHNRRHFYDRLSLECERSVRHGAPFALLVLKLEAPPVERGEPPARVSAAVLRTAAEMVEGLTRPSDLVALINSDEFAVLLVDVDREQASNLIERVRQAISMRLPALVNDYRAWPTVKGGFSVYGEDGRTPEALVEAAEASLSSHDESAAARQAA